MFFYFICILKGKLKLSEVEIFNLRLKNEVEVETEVEEQVYEEVTGFESLNSNLQTRTTAFTCKSDSEGLIAPRILPGKSLLPGCLFPSGKRPVRKR